MTHVLCIEAFSEAEVYFMQLLKLANVQNVKVVLSTMHSGKLCNDYTIDEEGYERIRHYLMEERV